MTDSGWKFPLKALLLLLVGFVLTALLGFFLVYPVLTDIKRAEARLMDVKAQIEVKEILGPLYVNLRAALAGLPEDIPHPMPAVEPLDQSMDQISLMLMKMSEAHGLTTMSISPAMDALSGAPRSIVISMVMRGPLAAFHSFLLDLLQQAYVEDIRSVSAREAGANREYELEFVLHYR